MTKKEKFLVPNQVLKEFFNIENIIDIIPYGNGHINKTYKIIFPSCEYIIQKINSNVFENPFAVMHNIEIVTDYIRKNMIYEGQDPQTGTLSIILTRYGQNMAIIDDEYWRCTRFIDEATTYERTDDPKIFKEAGKAVGDFQKLLKGIHTRTIVDTIKHFHDTPYRYLHFLDVIKIDRMNRVMKCQSEINYVKSHSDQLGIITELLAKNVIPRRITHNDTKLNNILLSKKDGTSLGLLDLDTVMRGSLLYDYGDALRMGASNSEEDERDLTKVTINFEMFEAFTRGYLEASKNIIEHEEIKHLVDGFFLMTFELGMRFLTDYIDGDSYFQLNADALQKRPHLNLERAKNQLKLASEIENNYSILVEIINKILKEQNYNIQI